MRNLPFSNEHNGVIQLSYETEKFTEALEMAKAANEAKNAFLGGVSHDIRTPMNAILKKGTG